MHSYKESVVVKVEHLLWFKNLNYFNLCVCCSNSVSPPVVVEFLDPQQQVVACVGGSARLHCRFSSSGPVASCWIHDREKV